MRAVFTGNTCWWSFLISLKYSHFDFERLQFGLSPVIDQDRRQETGECERNQHTERVRQHGVAAGQQRMHRRNEEEILGFGTVFNARVIWSNLMLAKEKTRLRRLQYVTLFYLTGDAYQQTQDLAIREIVT